VLSTTKVIFKDYIPQQAQLLPPSLEELIEPNHPVLVVNQVIDSISIRPLQEAYQGGGAPSYHPKMMLKVLIYGYLSNIYSSRKLEAALKENIHFMWLSGMARPDHNSINRFRSKRLAAPLKEIFVQIVQLLSAEGLLDIRDLYTDGTKLEANANRYTFVWGKNISRGRERIKEQIDSLWAYAQQVAKEEEADTAPLEFDPADPEQVAQAIARIDQTLAEKPTDPKVRQKLNYARKHWPDNLRKYQHQESLINAGEKRSSFSKTDTDATFMRMKEDHMRNGQLKPAYNLQVSSNNQYIVNYTIHQLTTDTQALIKHLEHYRTLYQQTPAAVTADAGYGSEQNYAYLEKEKVENFVKYNHFDREQRSPHKQNPFAVNQLHYDEQTDTLTCPAQQTLYNVGTRKCKNDSGYEQVITHYRALSCEGCVLREKCHQSKHDREVQINHQLRLYKQQAAQRLTSEKGIIRRKKRPVEIEPVFAQIKHNKGFKRFMLRGLEKVQIETGLIAIAHNLAKKAARSAKN
jgi:transposase